MVSGTVGAITTTRCSIPLNIVYSQIVPSNVTLARLVQPLNADESISVTLFGMIMLVRLVQSRNADEPIIVTLFGRVTLARLVQFIEHLVGDSRYACWYGYAVKVAGIGERIVADSGKRAAFRKGYGSKGGIRTRRCPSECVVGDGISAVADFRYGQIRAVCVSAVKGGYVYGGKSSVSAVVDAVGGIAVDKRKLQPCRAGGVCNGGFIVRMIIIAHSAFYAVCCYRSGRWYCFPIVRGGVNDFACGGCRIAGAHACFHSCGCAGGGSIVVHW